MKFPWLNPVAKADGPFLSVYLDTTRSDEAGAHEVELRWAALREHAEAAGAPSTVVDAAADAVLRASGLGGAQGKVVVATEAGVVLDRTMPQPPQREEVLFGPVPHLLPVVRTFSHVLPYVLVQVNREGADIVVSDPRGGEVDAHTVEAGHDVLHKVPGGGWSQRRYQSRVEDSWERNAQAVAQDLDKVVARHHPQAVVVTGDVRAASALREHAGERTRELLVHVEGGGRADGSSPESLHEAVEEVLAVRRHEIESGDVDRFEQQRGRQEAATEGLDAVVDALRKAQVEELLLQDDPSSTATLWVGSEPTQIGTTREELAALGVDDPHQVRADAAISWALLSMDAGITLVQDPPTLRDGIGALLRWSDASTPH